MAFPFLMFMFLSVNDIYVIIREKFKKSANAAYIDSIIYSVLGKNIILGQLDVS